jgi:PilZ domain
MTKKEQRRAWRSQLLLEVTYEGAGVQTETRISDISVTGVYIEIMSAIPVGSNLKLTFTLPDGHAVHTEGVVVHSQPQTGVGVEFTTLKREDAHRIRQFIRA